MIKILMIAGIVLAGLIIVALLYAANVWMTYRRVEDAQPLKAEGEALPAMETGTVYTITTYNIGFGAYSPDYSFFMDGGQYARALSCAAVIENVIGAAGLAASLKPDFAFFQEVDTRATRSRHVDELRLLKSGLPGLTSIFALNYDSPYLLYPLTQPIGKSVSGIVTFSRFSVVGALRRSLPVEAGFRKLIDLDRCYSLTRIPVFNNKQLVLINLHLSAYTKDAHIGARQLQMVFEDASREYKAGHYVLIGGDFNKDVLGDSADLFGTKERLSSWALPLDRSLIPEGFTVVRPENEPDIHPTVRDTDAAYVPGETFVAVIDGFILSDNITPVHEEIVDAGFAFSDHNPVLLRFKLNGFSRFGRR